MCGHNLQESSVNNFQHLWTDGVFDRGADTAPTQYLNAAVEMVCARAEGRMERVRNGRPCAGYEFAKGRSG